MQNELFTRKSELYESALYFWKASLYINFATLIFFLFSVYIDWSPFAWIFGLVSLIAPTALIFCREMFNTRFREADKCKRILHYTDGLGLDIPGAEAACLLGTHRKKKKSEKPVVTDTEPFYVSKKEKGPERLLEDTRESAYFTFNNARTSKWISTGVISVMILIVAVIFHEIITTPVLNKTIQNYAKSAAAIISFLLTGDVSVICYRYFILEADAKKSYFDCDSLLKRGNIELHEVTRTVEDYDISVLLGPPILPKIYEWTRDNLNAAYQKAHQ